MHEIFGGKATKVVLSHSANLAETSSVEEFLLKIDKEPELLHKSLIALFGRPSLGIWNLIQERFAERQILQI